MRFVNYSHRLILMLAGSLLILSIAGCTAKQYRRVDQSGFLGDYSKLREKQENEALYVYINPKADCRKYKKVIIDPVSLWSVSEDSELATLDQKDKKMLMTQGWGIVYDGMTKGKFKIVDKPGADVMRVRSAITEASKANVMLANILAVAPYAWEAATLWGIGSGKWPFLGELAGEMEIVDSQTGERLFASVDKVVGTMGSNIDPRASWDDVRKGFNMWRDKLGQRMLSCQATGSFKMPKDSRNWVEKTYEYMSP
jgi:Protein of unknown function (DUF3313)